MAKVNPNSSEFDGGGGILGAGTHVAFISDIEIGESEAKKTPYVEFTFECHDPKSEHNGKTLRYQRYYITEKTTWRFVQVCRAARPDGCPPVDTEVVEELIRELRDRPLIITVVLRKQEGYRDKLEVSEVSAISASDERRLRDAWGDSLVPPMKDGDGDTFSDDHIPY